MLNATRRVVTGHDAHALYVVQWASNQTYPIKLELAAPAS